MKPESRIRLLSDTIANKIAAGEVIERPASVIKELVENSVDAGAHKIFIEVRNGGKDFIKVTDNGSGMVRDDAILAFERHATSKIKEFEDLDVISSFGFRGEALPSIAAVSRVILTTAPEGDQPGAEVLVSGGKLLEVKQILREPGTTIEVNNLFFNVPARRKFLKTALTELSHITDTVANLALINTGIHFRLLNDGRLTLDFLAEENFEDRIYKVIGKNERGSLVVVNAGDEQCRVFGFVSKPSTTRLGRSHQKLFLNRRFIRDRLLSAAVYRAYRNTIAEGRHPIVFLAVEMPSDLVDVNVHPTKVEVRFRNSDAIYGLVLQAVQQAVRGAVQPSAGAPLPELYQATAPWQLHERYPQNQSAANLPQPAADSKSGRAPLPSRTAVAAASPETMVPTVIAQETFVPEAVSSAAPAMARSRPIATPPESPAPFVLSPATTAPDGLPRVIGQLFNTFILLDDNGDLLMIDQHTAHERILFEKFQRQRAEQGTEKQKLLLPVTFDLSPRDAFLVNEHLPALSALGFDIEPFGPKGFLVVAMPSLLKDYEPIGLLHDMIDEIQEVATTAGAHEQLDAITKIMACKAAVKANQRLTQDAMTGLVAELFRTSKPDTCPHGRPIIMRLPLKHIHKYFRR